MAAGMRGDGELATAPRLSDLIRRHDWSATSLGPPEGWPQSLRTIIDMMQAAGHAMCVMWGPDRTFLYNDAYAPILGLRHPSALGLPTRTVWPEIWADIAPLVERTFAGETVTFEELPLVMTRNGFEEETWWDFSYSPLRDEHGTVAGLLNVTLDVGGRVIARRERDAAIAELRDSEAFNRSVLGASTDCIKVVELDGTLSFMTEGGMHVMEISDFNDVRGCPWPDFLKEDGSTLARDALEAARQGRSSHFVTEADTFLGTPRSWSVSVSPILDADGRTSRILSVSRDVTELAQAREQLVLLNGELAHRIKNMMSVVQAIAGQTIGKVADAGTMRAFGDRLATLAASHDLLTGRNWSAAPLEEVARRSLSTFGEDRFDLSGPPVEVGSRATLACSLLLHELATNAVKYGALSVPDGKVAVAWKLQDEGAGDNLHLSWRERGGPPAIRPTRKGFGSRIIGMGLTGSGGVTLDYGTNGLSVEASAPLHQLQEA